MKAMKKNLAGVSPVIAVILMVAITVVLAGVVFLWAQSFTSDTGDTVKTLNIKTTLDINAFPGTAAAGDEEAGLEIEVLGGTMNWNDYKVIITIGGSDITIYNQPLTYDGTGAALTANIDTQSLAGESVWYTQNAATMPALTAGASYTVKIVDIDGNRVAWTDETVIAKN